MTPAEIALLQDLRVNVARVEENQKALLQRSDDRYAEYTARLDRIEKKLDDLPANGKNGRKDQLVATGGAGVVGGGVVGLIITVGQALGWF